MSCSLPVVQKAAAMAEQAAVLATTVAVLMIIGQAFQLQVTDGSPGVSARLTAMLGHIELRRGPRGESMISREEMDANRRTYHPLFHRRNIALRAVEAVEGRRLSIEEVMLLLGCNENVVRQTRDGSGRRRTRCRSPCNRHRPRAAAQHVPGCAPIILICAAQPLGTAAPRAVQIGGSCARVASQPVFLVPIRLAGVRPDGGLPSRRCLTGRLR